MYLKLGDIATIQFGPYEKGKPKGTIKYLLGSHFDDTFQPRQFDANPNYLQVTEKTERFLLKDNDVMLAGKGLRIFAWAYSTDFGRAIPSSLFYILKIDPSQLLGKYLAYYLNVPQMQYQLKTISAGGTLPSIPKKELMQLKIQIPSLAKQQEMIDLATILETDISLTQELLKQKQLLKQGLLAQLLKK